MGRRSLPLEERRIDVKCSIPRGLKEWAESRGICFSAVLATALTHLMDDDVEGATVNDLRRIEALKSEVAALENRVCARTGRTADDFLCEENVGVTEEHRRYQDLYDGMNPRGTHPETQALVQEVAAGNTQGKAKVIAWISARAKDFGLLDSPERALQKLIQFRPWESEEPPPGGA
jgi:hypothetical protein